MGESMLIRWQSTIVDQRGNVAPGSVLTVRRESDQSIAAVYRDAAGTDPYPTGTVTADENGYAYFYATPGLYRLTSLMPAVDWRDVNLDYLEQRLADTSSDATGAALIGWKGRTQADKNRDVYSVYDAGAVGDGATNDTTAFADFEAVVQGRIVDLFGRTYVVDTLPEGNAYDNGYFSVGGQVIFQSARDNNNYCWNGNFDLWSDRVSFTSFASRSMVADGFTYSRSGFASGSTVSRQPGSRGSNYCARVARNSGDTSVSGMTLVFNLSQADSRAFVAAQRATLSFRARKGFDYSPASSLLVAQIKGTTAAAESSITAANGTYTSGDTTLGGLNAALTTDFQDFVTSVSIPAGVTQVAVRFTCAPTGTAGDEDWFEVEEVKFEASPTRTRFTPTPLALAIEKSREIFMKSYNADTQPGSVTYEGAIRQRARGTEASGAVEMTVQTQMRANPTVTIYSPVSGASGKMSDGSADFAATTTLIGRNGFTIINNAAVVDGDVYFAHYVARCPL